MSKVIIFKNDRTGDLFTSIPTINLIFNKHINNDIELFLSKINYKFSFLFKPKRIKVINLDLNQRPGELSNEMFYKIALQYEDLFG